MIFRTDVNGTLVYVDSEWTLLSGYSSSESMGKKLEEFLIPDDRERFTNMFNELMHNGLRSVRQELRCLTKNHELKQMEVLLLKSTDDHNHVLGAVGSIRSTISSRIMRTNRGRVPTTEARTMLIPYSSQS